MIDRNPLDYFRFRQTEPGRYTVRGPRQYMEQRGARILWNLTHNPAEFRQFLRDRTGSDFEMLQEYVGTDFTDWSNRHKFNPLVTLVTTVAFPGIDSVCHNG